MKFPYMFYGVQARETQGLRHQDSFPLENGQGTIEKSTAQQNKTIIAQLPKIDLCFLYFLIHAKNGYSVLPFRPRP